MQLTGRHWSSLSTVQLIGLLYPLCSSLILTDPLYPLCSSLVLSIHCAAHDPLYPLCHSLVLSIRRATHWSSLVNSILCAPHWSFLSTILLTLAKGLFPSIFLRNTLNRPAPRCPKLIPDSIKLTIKISHQRKQLTLLGKGTKIEKENPGEARFFYLGFRQSI